ncbi:hypothetical protein [Clostridium senegalense]|uniref:hypothetical protein n=1 Tax=Clostridium senegalense TaxID=1465809 RepID=UPI000288B637|nr:hypothetical protein [Clostridium senegalense]MBU5225808.1 hypothetical protein [Clostridium senegalense]
MSGKELVYTIIGIVLIILLGPTILSIFGTVISFIFTIVGIIILLTVLGVLYLKHKAKKQFKSYDQSYSQYNKEYKNKTNSENLYTAEDEESVIIDVDYEDIDDSK